MRLNALVPSIPANLVTCLEQCGIRTDADLLFSGTTAEIFRRLPPGTTTFHELAGHTALVAKITSAPGISAADLLSLENTRKESADCLLSGFSDLDKLLAGFGGSSVLEISGDKGSGKTSLVLHIVLRHLATHPGSGALWIDSTGEFSAEKTSQLLGAYGGQASSTALERLQVSLAFDLDAAHDVLETLRSLLNSASQSETNIRCIVIDCITPLIGPLLSAVSSQGHAIMTGFMRQLRAFAQSFSLAIFVINNTTASIPSNTNSSTARKPALGPSFPFLTDATLWLSSQAQSPGKSNFDEGDGSTIHVAEVLRSKTTPSKTCCTFKIRHGVLLDM